jgi:hypothetical protein
MSSSRLEHLIRFYSVLDRLEQNIGGARRLTDCSGRIPWPKRGVYLFRESGENRADSGSGPRIVRVGTHALKLNAKTKLWTRLSQHRGTLRTGGGNHRVSIFRLIVGVALIKRHQHDFPTWGKGKKSDKAVKQLELVLECEVSQYLGAMTLIWVPILDEASAESLRGYVERNSIALLSNCNRPPLDPPSPGWLGND